jgi:hypothetical protein
VAPAAYANPAVGYGAAAVGVGAAGGAAGSVCAQCRLQGDKCAQLLNGQASCSSPGTAGEQLQ